MQRWSGRVALVTGASAGIGAAVCRRLLKHGMTVVGAARRREKIPEAVGVPTAEADPTEDCVDLRGRLFTLQCDVSQEEDVVNAVQWVIQHLGGVHLLVNNAGLFCDTPLTQAETVEWQLQLNVNVLGLMVCTREVVAWMRSNKVDEGHIINISSIAGHLTPQRSIGGMYFATKHAVRVLTEALRKDLAESKTPVRASCISPGLVKTDILMHAQNLSKNVFETLPYLHADDIADAVEYMLAAPPHVQVHDIILAPAENS